MEPVLAETRMASSIRILVLVLLAASFSRAQSGGDMGKGGADAFLHDMAVTLRLEGPDSLVVTVSALSEDFQNTVEVYPYSDSDPRPYRLLEGKLESYLQGRIPVRVDGKRVPLNVVRWKPEGKGRGDGLDSASVWAGYMFISLGGRIPAQRTRLDATVNMWAERPGASGTSVEMTLMEGPRPLRRLWTQREKTVTFPLHPDSLAAMRANPPPPDKN
jgi:hypothetical protein